MTITTPIHPSIRRAFNLLEPYFVEWIISEKGQRLLARQENWRKFLATMPSDELREDIYRQWTSQGDETSAREKWEFLRARCSPPERDAAPNKRTRVSFENIAGDVFEGCCMC